MKKLCFCIAALCMAQLCLAQTWTKTYVKNKWGYFTDEYTYVQVVNGTVAKGSPENCKFVTGYNSSTPYALFLLGISEYWSPVILWDNEVVTISFRKGNEIVSSYGMALKTESGNYDRLSIALADPLSAIKDYEQATRNMQTIETALVWGTCDILVEGDGWSLRGSMKDFPLSSLTSLYFAIRANDTERVRAVLESGLVVDLNKKTEFLNAALWGGNLDIIKLLVDHGYDLNNIPAAASNGNWGATETPLVHILRTLDNEGHDASMFLQSLFALGLKADAQYNGQNLMAYILSCKVYDHGNQRALEEAKDLPLLKKVCDTLLAHGMDINAPQNGVTVLDYVRNQDLAKYFIEQGAYFTSDDTFMNTDIFMNTMVFNRFFYDSQLDINETFETDKQFFEFLQSKGLDPIQTPIITRILHDAALRLIWYYSNSETTSWRYQYDLKVVNYLTSIGLNLDKAALRERIDQETRKGTYPAHYFDELKAVLKL